MIATAALAAASACTGDTGDQGASGQNGTSDEDRLLEMINEGSRIEAELDTIELRVVKQCLEDEGYTVHDEIELMGWEAVPITGLFTEYPHSSFLPTAEEAAEEGFGFWRTADEDADVEWGEDDQGEQMPDNTAWEALSEREQYDWYEAFYGAEHAEEYYRFLIDPDAPTGHEGGGRNNDDDEGEDGEIGVSDGVAFTAPEPGGCQREMIDALYDDLRLVEEVSLETDETHAYWRYRPENPTWNEESRIAVEDEYLSRVRGAEGDLIECLVERGQSDWEFNDHGQVLVYEYFSSLYWGEDAGGVELPEDAPTDFEGKKAHEIATAVDFAECGDASGYRETAATAYTETQVEYFASVETASYAWQEEMRAVLDEAQKLLS
ncbi:hypothetical protein AB0B28_03660 [Glycomyces sp. NPDC046736]|uniref:hypothetical protein n=1 Tax=Glycomyces sp. NPDC046736 TaxID=3155615 RepID=UPI0033C0A584